MLDKQDKKELKKIMVSVFNDGVDQLINPQFGEIGEDIQELKEGQETIKVDLGDLRDSQERMERKLD